MKQQRYFLQLAYKGTNFHGWQRQKKVNSVQETIEKALSTVLRQKIEIMGAGRTDTGVHASFYVAHFDTDVEFDPKVLLKKINGITPRDIVIHKIFPVPNKAHARFDAISRTYKYFIHTRLNPFIEEFSYHIYWKPNLKLMEEATKILFEYEDFKAFSKSSDVKTYICKIYEAYWTVDNDKLIFTIKANRFLRNMVRAIVGTLLEISRERLMPDDFRRIIEARDRKAALFSAPAKGLFLVDIQYPEEIEKLLDKNYKIFWNENI